MMLSIYPRINKKQCHTVFMASFAKLLNLYRRRSVAETLVSILRRKSKDAGAVQIPLATLQFMTKTCEEYETFYNNGALCPKEMKDFLRLHVQADVVRKWLAAMMLKHLNWKACVTFFFFFFFYRALSVIWQTTLFRSSVGRHWNEKSSRRGRKIAASMFSEITAVFTERRRILWGITEATNTYTVSNLRLTLKTARLVIMVW